MTGFPSNTDSPLSVGMVVPIAGSLSLPEYFCPSYCGSGVPETVTLPVSNVVAFAAWSWPPPDATTATIAAIATTAATPPQSNHRLRR